MGNTTKIVAGALGGLLIAGYSGLWFYTNQAHKREVESTLLSLQDSPVVKSLTYEKISVSGFPFKNNVVVHKPKIVLDTNQLKVNNPSAPAIFKDNVKLAFYTKDALCFSTSPIFSDYQILPQGDIHSVFISDSKEKDFVLEHGNSIQIKSKKSFKKAIQQLSSDLNDYPMARLLARMSDIEYNSGKLVVKDLHNNILATSDSTSITFNMATGSVKDTIAIKFDLNKRGMVLTEDYAKAINALYDELNVASRLYSHQEDYGKRNMKMHLDLSMGNSTQGDIFSSGQPLVFHGDWTADCDLYKTAHKYDVKIRFNGDELDSADITLASTHKSEPGHYPALDFLWQNTLAQVSAGFASTEGITPEQQMLGAVLIGQARDLCPKIHELGNIQFNLKSHVTQKEQKLVFNVERLDFDNDLYSIHSRVNNDYNVSSKESENGDVSIEVGALHTLLDRWYPVYTRFAGPNDVLLANSKSFLDWLAVETNEAKNHHKFTIAYKAKPELQGDFCGKDAAEIDVKFAELFG